MKSWLSFDLEKILELLGESPASLRSYRDGRADNIEVIDLIRETTFTLDNFILFYNYIKLQNTNFKVDAMYAVLENENITDEQRLFMKLQ